MKVSRWIFVGLAVLVVATACGRSSGTKTTTATSAATGCSNTTLKATDVGITADTITVEVMADVGSPLAPGLFQANLDAVKAYATYVNAHGGIGCRKLAVRTWDSQLKPEESTNGLIDACANAVAMVGNNALFNPNAQTLAGCKDSSGAATGLPDIAALANDVHEECNATTYSIQIVADNCPITAGTPRPIKAIVGPTKYLAKQTPGLHGMFLVPGDLPTTIQSATPQIKAQADAGIAFDTTPKVTGRALQAAYTDKVLALKEHASTYVFDGAGDRAMVNLRKEAKAQGVDSVKVWMCALGCYTKNLLATGGADTEGTYVWMQFLPFEEASANPELQRYLDGVGADKADSFGAQAWQAAVAFREVVDGIVKQAGPNGITRKAILGGLAGLGDFDANGWMGKKDLRGVSPCYVLLQVKAGKFVRVHPVKAGTFDCDAANVVTETIDPAVEAAKLK